MRLWSIHPKYLDTKGLLAVWREGLLAKKVLENKTKGYKHHPQLLRFQQSKNPLETINAYLFQIYLESQNRGYSFNGTKIEHKVSPETLPVTLGQMYFEIEHLLKKLATRDPKKFNEVKNLTSHEPNIIFQIVPGNIESWEK